MKKRPPVRPVVFYVCVYELQQDECRSDGGDGQDQPDPADHAAEAVGPELLRLAADFVGVELNIRDGASAVPAPDDRLPVDVLLRLEDREDLVQDEERLVVIQENDAGLVLQDVVLIENAAGIAAADDRALQFAGDAADAGDLGLAVK